MLCSFSIDLGESTRQAKVRPGPGVGAAPTRATADVAYVAGQIGQGIQEGKRRCWELQAGDEKTAKLSRPSQVVIIGLRRSRGGPFAGGQTTKATMAGPHDA